MTPFHLYYPNYYKDEEVVSACLSVCLWLITKKLLRGFYTWE